MIDPILLGLLVAGGVLLFLLTAAPIAIVLGVVTVILLVALDKTIQIQTLAMVGFGTSQSFVLVTLPLFILMGEFILRSGIGADLYEVGSRWLSRVPGGLGMSTTIACAIFGAMCGSSSAATATVGLVSIPEMVKRGYSRQFAVGFVAGAGGLASIIPPSLLMIIYASVSDASIGKLFMAGFGPGLVMAFIFCVYAFFMAKYGGVSGETYSVSWKDRITPMVKLWPAPFLIASVLGTIYFGIATPTEAAGIGALGAFLLGTLVYRGLNWEKTKTALASATRTTGMMYFIIIGATFLGIVLTRLQVPQSLAAVIIDAELPPYVVIFCICILILLLGCFVTGTPIVLVTTPILLPIVQGLGFDSIWYGIILVVLVEIGTITPPVGSTLFVLKGVLPDLPLEEIIRGSLPFVALKSVVVAIIVAVPQIALWLPSTMLTTSGSR